jgi:hypothetical protein
LGNTKWKAEPTDVEKSADELWLAEKFQSNSELAGSLRNALRRSGDDELSRGKATVSVRAAKAVPSRGKLRILGIAFRQPVRLAGISL